MARQVFGQVQRNLRAILTGNQPPRILQRASKSTAIPEHIDSKPEEKVRIDNDCSQTGTWDGHPQIDLSFNNGEEAFRSKSNAELLRALLVLRLCSVSVLVDNNKTLLKWSRKILGRKAFKKLMKGTFFGHFVAGEDQVDIRPLVNKNRKFGVKTILDYSAEEDISSLKAAESEMRGCQAEQTTDISKEPEHQRYVAHREFADRRDKVVSSRTYFYEGEEQCDKNMNIFLDSIDGVSDATEKTGFCAVKLTALGRPQLLLQLSDVLVSARQFFEKMTSGDGDNFSRGFHEEEFVMKLHDMGIRIAPEESHRWFSLLDISQDGQVDILDWENLLDVNISLSKLFVVPNPQTGELVPLLTGMSEDTEREMRNMLKRVDKIARYAMEKDVRVMIDAEQTYFQPAINRLTIEMMKSFNKEKAIVFNTYQCYLKSAFDNIRLDLDISYRNNFYFGAKLVRGAYMEQERERAQTIGYEDPINPNYEATTAMYYKVLREVMRQIQLRDKGNICIMVASHNEGTVKYTVEKMKEFNVKPSDRVICFGQLLGMCDQVSFPLGQAGYSVYKYVPYGPVEEVLPYLSRRAMENKSMLNKVKKERSLLRNELGRRLRCGQFRYDPVVELAKSKNIVN